jgi:hypothetical protein
MTDLKKSDKLAGEIEAARERRATLMTEVSGAAERLAKLRGEYQRAVEGNEPESKLDQRDDELLKVDRELARARIRLSQVEQEVVELTKQHAQALADEEEQEFLRQLDVLVEDKFIMAEMALQEFKNRISEIEASVRGFMNQAVKTGRDVHRLRINDNLRRQIGERLYPGYQTKSRPDIFAAPLADVLENHVRTILSVPTPANGKAGPAQLTETLNEEGEEMP